MTTLRSFLEEEQQQKRHQSTTIPTPTPPPRRIAILESPTGTGKSQMLLNSVLSSLFAPISEVDRPVCDDSDSLPQQAEPQTAVEDLASSSAGPTLAESVEKRRVEELQENLRRERRCRIRAERRLHRRARRYAQQRRLLDVSIGVVDPSAAHLLHQDPVAWMQEQGRAASSCGTSSSSSFSSSTSSSSDVDEDDDIEGRVEAELATMIPLRKPKVYFASRTHTQLQQLMDDYTKTAFSQQRVIPQQHGKLEEAKSMAPGHSEASNEAAVPRYLSAVHVASRSQLCLNARVLRKAGGDSSLLNHYCREAMRFERSKDGRAQRRSRQAKGEVPSSESMLSGLTPAAVVDIEEMDTQMAQRVGRSADADDGDEDQGCRYCAQTQLRALVEYLQQERRAAEGDPTAAASSVVCCSLDVLRHLGRELHGCPYLASRLLLRGADIAFTPYNYLIDEVQRLILLGGVTTNAISPDEALAVEAAMGVPVGPGYTILPSAKDSSAGATHLNRATTSLAAVLYHRQQRLLSAAALHNRHWAAGKNLRQNGRNRLHRTDLDDEAVMWRTAARCAPPSFTGDVLVFDEAHNLADQCSNTSTVSIAPQQLRLVQELLQAYLHRYESRLLTQNKQHLRELIRLFTKLIAFCNHVASSSSRIFDFNAFLFTADIDSVDVYPLLLFIVDTQLFVKLAGFITYCLNQDAEEEVAPKSSQHVTQPLRKAARVQMKVHNSEGSDAGATDFTVTTPLSSCMSVKPAAASVIRELLQSASGCDGSGAIDHQRLHALAQESLRRVEHLLRWLYLSDQNSRVLWATTTTVPAPLQTTASNGVLKLIQLAPGQHTVSPLFHEAAAVVLAGGTMQPLALTCGPLLPGPITVSPSLTSPSSIFLIQEGHIVPPSSVGIWALGSGPSGLRLELSHHALQNATATTPPLSRLLAELGCLLLNFSRMLPPAGVICFFTSYEAEQRFVDALWADGYYAQINSVKRIFRETDGRVGGGGAMKSTGGSSRSCGVGGVLEAYQRWVYGIDTGGVDTPSSPIMARGATRGALLFAVMGGRLAEGINFADDLGRAVLLFGLPYANAADPELQLALKHIAQSTVGGAAVETHKTSAPPGPSGFSTAEWGLYTDGCMRVVNQCVGRCIRHAKDYAAVILVDARYAERAPVRSRLSAWLQPSVRVPRGFRECFAGVRNFFEEKRKESQQTI